MAKRRGDDVEGGVTSVGRLGKGSPDGWQNGRDRTDDEKPVIPAQRQPVSGWGRDGVEVTR